MKQKNIRGMKCIQEYYQKHQNGQITSMSDFVNNIVYDSEKKSRLTSYVLMNGMEKNFSYNEAGNISEMKYSFGNINTGFSYRYDENYNIISRTSLESNKTSWFTYDKASRLIKSELNGAFETNVNLEARKLAQIDRDLAGTKDAEVFFEQLPQDIIFDAAARAFVYDFGNTASVTRIELFPDYYTHRVRERDVRIYVKESESSDWAEIRNWRFTKDSKNGSLTFAFKEAVNARQIKIRCIWDDRNFLNQSIESLSTFKGSAQNLLRIWALQENMSETYAYDSNSNRISLSENSNSRNYLYYKNQNGGNTARVMYDGKWWYTYDENGNRTARASKGVQNGNSVAVDKTCEYWEYTWDLWNRLVKVEQHNALDNARDVCVEYTYDALNYRIERVSRTGGAVEKTQYAYGRNGAITYQKKTTENTVTTRSYAYLNNQIVGWTEKEGDEERKYYTVTDIQGSVSEVYDEAENLVWKSGYTAFGIKAGETTNLIDFDGLYTGCDYDPETGLTYHWNRWQSEDGYNWLSEDPARDGVNWYGYAGQNPINYVDPSGLVYYTGPTSSSVKSSSDYYGITGNSESNGQTNSNLYEKNKSIDDFNWINEIGECFNSVEIGLRDELDVNIPGFLKFNAYINLGSAGSDNENISETVYSQGVGVSLALTIKDFTLIKFSYDYTRKGKKSEGFNTPLDLFGFDFETSMELDQSPTYDITVPIPGFSLSLNLTEVNDLFNKIDYQFTKFITENFESLFSKEKSK